MQNSLDADRKIAVFEDLNFFNFALALAYRRAGFRVLYFSISSRLQRSTFVDKFSIKDIKTMVSTEGHAFREIEHLTNELALGGTEFLYKSFFEKKRSAGIMKELFKSNSIDLVYKKVILEGLEPFSRKQIILNMLAKAPGLDSICYIPSRSCYFLGLARRFQSIYALSEKVRIPWYSCAAGRCLSAIKRIIHLFLFALWPFGLIKNIRGIDLKDSRKQEYSIAMRLYKNGYNFDSENLAPDFLFDGKGITRDNTLFCIETEIDMDFREGLIKKGYHFADIPNILARVSPGFIGRVYLGMVLPAWMKLCLVLFFEPVFIIRTCRNMLGSYLRWKAFLHKYSVKNHVVYNDFTLTHIIRNMVLSQGGVKTWYYCHSGHVESEYPQVKAGSGADIKSFYFSYLFYDNFVSWGERLSEFYMGHQNRVSNFLNVGCLWSEHIRGAAEKEAYGEPLASIRAECIDRRKKIISVFDTSFGGESFLSSDDMERFLQDILRLSEERKDLFFIVKPKFALDIGRIRFSKVASYYEDMMARPDFHVFKDLHDPSRLIAISDLTISACFSSTGKEAWGAKKKAVYYDATNLWRGASCDRLPNAVAHSYEELAAAVDYWLYKITDEEWDAYVDRHIRPGIDPYCDGRGITRFRELLMK